MAGDRRQVRTVFAQEVASFDSRSGAAVPSKWAEEDHVLAALEEAEVVGAVELLVLDGGLEDEVEVSEQLHSREPAASSSPGSGRLTKHAWFQQVT